MEKGAVFCIVVFLTENKLFSDDTDGPILQFGSRGLSVWRRKDKVELRLAERKETAAEPKTLSILSPEGALLTDQANQIAVVYNYSTGVASLMVNNFSVSDSFSGNIATDGDLNIGSTGTEKFKGYLNCLQIFDTAMDKHAIDSKKNMCEQGQYGGLYQLST